MVGVSEGWDVPEGSGVHEGVNVIVEGMPVSVGIKEISVEAGNRMTTTARQVIIKTADRNNQSVTLDWRSTRTDSMTSWLASSE
jgi:hypothetical protein